MRMKSVLMAALALCTVTLFSKGQDADDIERDPASPKVWYAKEMSTQDYKKLDRKKTAVFISSNILEEHGPYMPAYMDGYVTDPLVKDCADAVVKKGWDALVFPPIPIGGGACNEVGGLYPYPGSFTPRLYTFRALYMDLVHEIGLAGFRTVFLGNDHGSPNHGRMLSHICAYFSHLYPDGRLSLLSAGMGTSTPEIKKLEQEAAALMSAEAWKEDEHGGHADIEETSLMLHLQPKLVDPGYVNAPPMTISKYGSGLQGMIKMAKSPEWTGYFGSPKWATAKYGELRYKIRSLQTIAFVASVLDGKAPKPAMPGSVDVSKLDAPSQAALKRDAEIEKKQQEWLNKNGLK